MSQGTDKPTSPLPPGATPRAYMPRNLQMIIKLGFFVAAVHVLSSCCFSIPMTIQDEAGKTARGVFLWIWVPANLVASLAAAFILLRGCIACLELRRTGRKLVLFYAFGMLGWMACSTLLFIVMHGMLRFAGDEGMLYLCYIAALSTYPIASIVVMNDLPVRFLFEPPPEAKPATADAAKVPLFYGPLKPSDAERPAGAIGGTGTNTKKS